MNKTLTTLSLALASTAAAQAPIRPDAAAFARHELASVLLDTPGDGNTWALAPGYKMRFGTDGVDFVPFFGSRAPRNHPLTFRLRSVRCGGRDLEVDRSSQPRVSGSQVTYDRGDLREVWNLELETAEQTFVLTPGSARGDLVVTLDVRTELLCDQVEDGLRFLAPGLGEVRYGNVVATDTSGTRIETPSRWTGTGIELRLPASFVESARGPLTIDPLVRALTLGSTPEDERNPDLAYDRDHDRWLVVWERAFSARDIDVIASRFSGTGNLIEDAAVATGTRESLNPSVGVDAQFHVFLVAWDEDRTGDRIIMARLRDPRSTAQGAAFVALDTLNATDTEPDVGGTDARDSFAGNFLVVCEENALIGSASRIVALRVTSGANVEATFTLASGDAATGPAVTKVRHAGFPWVVTYHVRNGSSHELRAVAVAASDQVGTARVIGSGGDGPHSDVAGDGQQFLAVFARSMAANDRDLIGVELQASGTALTVRGARNLTRLEPEAAGFVAQDQSEPAIAHDGCRYTYLYLEKTNGTDDRVSAATLSLGPPLTFSDSHFPVGFIDENSRNLVIAAEGDVGGDAGELALAHERDVGIGGVDLEGYLFRGTSRSGGFVQRRQTGCGLIEPAIDVENVPALGATLRVRADPIQPGNQVMLLGLAPASPLPLCRQGCALGVTPILATAPGAALDLPIPCDPLILGAVLAVQNVLLVNLGGCAPPSLAVPLVTTDTLVFTVG